MPFATKAGFYDGRFVKAGGHYAGGDDSGDVVETGQPGHDSNDGEAPQTGQTGAGAASPNSDGTKPEPKKPEANG